MQRFRLMGFYVAGVVAAISLAVLGVSMKRTAADAATPLLSAAGPGAPSAANTEASQSRTPAMLSRPLSGSRKVTGVRHDHWIGKLSWGD